MKRMLGGSLGVCAFLALLACASSTIMADSFLDKIWNTPDYCQTDSAYGGFPDPNPPYDGHGGVFCGPTSVSNSLMWLDDHGFPNLSPNTSNRKFDQHELVEVIASAEYTDSYEHDGLSPTRLATGVSEYIHDCGYEYNRFEFQSWRNVPSAFEADEDIPDLDWARAGIASPTGVVLWSVGWYDYHASSNSYTREGGHWVTMVGYDDDHLIIHDPSSRTGYSLVNNYVTATEITDPNVTFPGGKAKGYHLLTGWPINRVGDYAILDGVYVIDMMPVNFTPVALDDAYGGSEDSTVTVYNYEGVLDNDTDDDGDPLDAVQYTSPLHGTLDLYANGALVYTPEDGYYGTDTFTYRAYDGTTYSDPATVTLQITSVNDIPVALDDAYAMDQGKTLVAYSYEGVLDNDDDDDNHDFDMSHDDTLTAVLESGPSNGTINLYSNGAFVYRPNPNFSGTESFTYKVFDGTDYSDLATVLIEVLAEAVPVPGDATGDGVVDQADMAILSDHWGDPVSGGSAMGDFNDDGVVDATDASILAANWGDHRESVAPAAVPEPNALGLFLAMSLAWLMGSRRRRVAR